MDDRNDRAIEFSTPCLKEGDAQNCPREGYVVLESREVVLQWLQLSAVLVRLELHGPPPWGWVPDRDRDRAGPAAEWFGFRVLLVLGYSLVGGHWDD